MKYQQLENLESGWKWQYLMRKHREGVAITQYQDSSEAQAAVEKFKQLEHQPVDVLDWIQDHLNPDLKNKLKQAIRAKRKRHFNAEHKHTKKKSIDLDYAVWEKLSERSQELGCTLSEAIEYLVSEASRTEKANKKVDTIKEDLAKLLDFPS